MMRKSSSNTNPSSHLQTSRFLLSLSVNASSDTVPSASPNSVLETKLFSSTVNHRKPRPTWHSAESRPVGLGIVDALRNEKPEIHRKGSNPDSRMVLFVSQPKIKIPSIHLHSVTKAGGRKSPGSPVEFGFNNKSLYLALLSSAPSSPVSCSADMWPPSTDMELSEDYTCVIAHGPNPRTTHIFDNCIVESCSADHTMFHHQRRSGPWPTIRSVSLPSAIPARRVLPWGRTFSYTEVKMHSAAMIADITK